MQSMPNATVRCAPKRALRRGVSGATMIMIGAIGSRRSAARQRAVAEHELEVLRDEEHHAVHREEHEDHAAGAGAERRVAEVVHVEHRLVGVCSSHEHEQREHDDRDDERDERAEARPALVGRLDEPVHEGDDADDREDRADRVELRLLGVARLRDEELPGDQRDRDDRAR